MDYHIAQVNIAKMRAQLDDPLMERFTSRLDEINALADASPGFIWRLQSDDENGTTLHEFDDDMIILNMSVWESIESLKDFVYKSTHLELLKLKKDWFSKMDTSFQALWWVAQGHIPDAKEAKAKLEILQNNGPCASAFTFTNVVQPETEENVLAAD